MVSNDKEWDRMRKEEKKHLGCETDGVEVNTQSLLVGSK